jgi:hypothetical protein
MPELVVVVVTAPPPVPPEAVVNGSPHPAPMTTTQSDKETPVKRSVRIEMTPPRRGERARRPDYDCLL